MPRLENAPAFELEEIAGCSVRDLLGTSKDGDQSCVDVLLLRTVESNFWHHIFLDAGIGFWDKWSPAEKREFFEFDEDSETNLAARWNLIGKKIRKATCIGKTFEDPILSEFRIEFETGHLVLSYVDPFDFESKTVVSFQLR